MSTIFLRRAIIAAATTAGLTLTGTAAAQSAPYEAPLERATGPVITGQYIVVLKEAGRGADVAGRHAVATTHVYTHALRGFAARLSPAQLKSVRSDRTVAYVVPDGIVQASSPVSAEGTDKPKPSVPTMKAPSGRRSGPVVGASDSTTPRSGQSKPPSWGLDRIDQRGRTLDKLYRYTATGSGVTAYVIDTGIQAKHKDFGKRVVAGFTAVSDGRGTTDCNGHGTHVSGTIGGSTYGVAKQVTLVPVRVLGCKGNGAQSGVLAGVDYVTYTHTGPSVANMSLGGGYNQALNDAVTTSILSGVTYVVAAGNFNDNACSYSPSSAPGTVTVGSTDVNDKRSSFSNKGPCVDLFAPGEKIVSAWIGGDTASKTISGTSMASPHVAGLAALYLQAAPYAAPLTVASVLLTSAVPNVVGDPAGSSNLLARKWNGQLAKVGDVNFEPDDKNWYQANSGYITATLQGTAGTDPDLHLFRWDGSAWVIVASSATKSAKEQLAHNASPGYYALGIHAHRGVGTYDVWSTHPS
ncbi:S8 family peptidase [Kineosporia babensis]|uniref:S8 family peptidase n=1 Tax=Kineosporia babensis TaxID=499548 RepID=A0A9X1NCB3_9ACTN|nr:S8 family peptidase [Kineosporia babensis]MCD5311146.1 S8 family peptidase [Kineosporia babensis]